MYAHILQAIYKNTNLEKSILNAESKNKHEKQNNRLKHSCKDADISIYTFKAKTSSSSDFRTDLVQHTLQAFAAAQNNETIPRKTLFLARLRQCLL